MQNSMKSKVFSCAAVLKSINRQSLDILPSDFPAIMTPCDMAPQDRSEPAFAQRKTTGTRKRTKVLSFEEDDDEEEAGVRIASAHDVLHADKSLAKATLGPIAAHTMPQSALARAEERSTHSFPVPESAKDLEPEPEGPVPAPSEVMAEIERVQRAIRAASAFKEASQASASASRKRAKRDDVAIKSKFKSWGESVCKWARGDGASVPAESRPDKVTLHDLISSAEGDQSERARVAGSDWLKHTGSIKFAIDSRNAFSTAKRSL